MFILCDSKANLFLKSFREVKSKLVWNFIRGIKIVAMNKCKNVMGQLELNPSKNFSIVWARMKKLDDNRVYHDNWERTHGCKYISYKIFKEYHRYGNETDSFGHQIPFFTGRFALEQHLHRMKFSLISGITLFYHGRKVMIA